MRKSRMSIILLAVAVVAFLALTTFAQSKAYAKPIELRLAHMNPVGSPSHAHIERWANKIAADSNGRLTIRIFPANTLIPAPEIYTGVVKGAADIGFAWRFKPEGYEIGVTFPFLITAPDTVTAGRVYDDIWEKFPQEMAEEWKDVKILWLAPSIPQVIFATKRIRTPEDMKGLQIRVSSKEHAQFMKEVGASPVYVPSPADFVIGLDKGTLDGACPIFSMISDFKLGKKIRSVLLFSLGVPTPVMVIMNKDSFNKLPADLQKVIEESREWGKKDAIRYWSKEYNDVANYCKAEGVELIYLSREERTQWVSIVDRVRDKIAADLDTKGYPGTEIVRLIKERIEHYAR